MSAASAATAALGELLAPSGRADPYRCYRELHQHGPVLELPGGVLVVCGHREAGQALRDPAMLVEDDRFADVVLPSWREHASRATLQSSMLCTDGDRHDRMRGLLREVFTVRGVEALRPAVVRLAAALADRLACLGSRARVVDFVAEFALRLPIAVICELLAVPAGDQDTVRGWVGELVAALEPGWAQADLAAADTAAAELTGYVAELCRRRPGGLVAAALAANRAAGKPCSTHELVANLVLLLVAGFETTANLLGSGLAVLLARPACATVLRERPDTAAQHVTELLRFDPPVQLTSRLAASGTSLGGRVVPAGGRVLVLIGAAHRDPARFAEPDEFRPGRPDNRPLSFGAGPHFCLGAPLARLQAQVAFPLLLQRFPLLAAAGPPVRHDRLTLRGLAALPVTLGARHA